MKSDAIRIVVRSRKIPVRVESVRVASPNLLGSTGARSLRLVVYEYALDHEQERLLGEARLLARRYGARLDVVDLAREGFVRRVTRMISSVFYRQAQRFWRTGPTKNLVRKLA